jgi:plasmid maintenance system antidote protein VapI
LQLARYLGTTAEFWMRRQARYDLETARQTRNNDIAAIKPRKTA